VWNFIRGIRREIFSAIVGLVAGGLVVAFLHDPILYSLVPGLMAWWNKGEVLEVYRDSDPRPFTEAEGRYSIYIVPFSLTGEEINGRMVVRENGHDNTDRQSFITGIKRHDMIAITYRPVHGERTGGGVSIGFWNPDISGYVGSLIGYGRDKTGGDCVVRKYWAVLADDRYSDRFTALASTAAGDQKQVALEGVTGKVLAVKCGDEGTAKGH
jgi:hypothetical protein